MATRERLKEQRAAMWRKGGWIQGMAIGLAMGFSIGSITKFAPDTLTPQWAYIIIAWGVGLLFGYLIRWKSTSNNSQSPPTPDTD